MPKLQEKIFELQECKDIGGRVTEAHCNAVKLLIDDIDKRGFLFKEKKAIDDLHICRQCTRFTVPPQPEICSHPNCNKENHRKGFCMNHYANRVSIEKRKTGIGKARLRYYADEPDIGMIQIGGQRAYRGKEEGGGTDDEI